MSVATLPTEDLVIATLAESAVASAYLKERLGIEPTLRPLVIEMASRLMLAELRGPA